jgi:antitoxin VapB
MRPAFLLKNGKNQAARLPNDMAYEGVGELEISRDGDIITLRPMHPTWQSLSQLPKADADLLQNRADVIGDEDRFEF